MSVDPKFFTAEHFAQTDRWLHTLQGRASIPIALLPLNGLYCQRVVVVVGNLDHKVESYVFILEDGEWEDQRFDGTLTYTPPDPWEGVKLDDIFLGGGIPATWDDDRIDSSRIYAHLPRRRFRLVPVENSK